MFCNWFKIDRLWLYSNRFGSHASTSTIAKQSAQLNVVLPTVAKLEEREGFEGKVTSLIRSFPETWEEGNGNMEWDKDDEEAGVLPLAMASEGTAPNGEEFRAVVVGDVSFMFDYVFQRSVAN